MKTAITPSKFRKMKRNPPIAVLTFSKESFMSAQEMEDISAQFAKVVRYGSLKTTLVIRENDKCSLSFIRKTPRIIALSKAVRNINN